MGTVLKGILLYLLQRVGQFDSGQTGASLKGRLSDLLQACSHFNGTQAGTALERRLVDAFEALADLERGQRTALKGLFGNDRSTAFDGHRFQRLILIESLLNDRSHLVGLFLIGHLLRNDDHGGVSPFVVDFHLAIGLHPVVNAFDLKVFHLFFLLFVFVLIVCPGSANRL